jgi:S-adenosyl-L-methionine hydrolase (adenosine-forming)
MADPVITFLSDFGHEDEFVGVCHGVIARRCPAARVIDVSHGVAPQDVRAGALMLRASLPYMPPAVHLAIVDPGVGIDAHAAGGDPGRRAVALATAQADQFLVGPDNGVLWPAAEELGGIVGAADVGRSRERLEPVSATFHGRDVFAPVAAALACGLTLEEVGEPIQAQGLTRLELTAALMRDGALHARVLDVDRFGNLTLDATMEQLSQLGAGGDAEIEVQQGAQASTTARCGRTFGDAPAGGLVAHEDSRRRLSLAVNRGSAASLLGAGPGDELVLRPR